MVENKKKSKPFSFEAVLTLIFVGTVIMCITIAVQVLMRGYATIGGYSLFRVVTGSMEPTIPTGALLVCDEMDISRISRGDIVCFRSKDAFLNESVITHRVYDIKFDAEGNIHLYTKGDANLSIDGYTSTEDNFIGKVTWYTKKGSFLMRIMGLLTSTYGFLTCVVFPVLILSTVVLQSCTRSIMRDIEMANAELDLAELQAKREKNYEFTQEDIQEMYTRIKEELMEELGISSNDGEV